MSSTSLLGQVAIGRPSAVSVVAAGHLRGLLGHADRLSRDTGRFCARQDLQT